MKRQEKGTHKFDIGHWTLDTNVDRDREYQIRFNDSRLFEQVKRYLYECQFAKGKVERFKEKGSGGQKPFHTKGQKMKGTSTMWTFKANRKRTQGKFD